MSEFADVSSEISSSERLLRLLVVALIKSFRSKRPQIQSYLAVHCHSIFDFVPHTAFAASQLFGFIK